MVIQGGQLSSRVSRQLWSVYLTLLLLVAALAALAVLQTQALDDTLQRAQNLPPSALTTGAPQLQALQAQLQSHQQTWLTAAGLAAALCTALMGWLAQGISKPQGDVDSPGSAPEVGENHSSAHASTLDPLTACCTREHFLAAHVGAVAHAANQGARAAVVCFDVERLKSMNALLGFDAGDHAIVLTARAARKLMATPDALARLGGGTFAGLLMLEEGESAVQRAQALRAALIQSAAWRSHTLDMSVAVGVAAAPEHGETTAELTRRAEQALFEAKRTRGLVGAYSASIEAARLSHLGLSADLVLALQRDELKTYLQPRWCVSTQRVVGAEALLRWHHPRRGCLLPAEFLPFAERTGRIGAITAQLLQSAVHLLNQQMGSLDLSVNVSVANLRDPAFVPSVRALLEDSGVTPARLRLEVAEKALLDGGSEALARLAELRALGLGVVVDNFGIGASPLAHLQRLPATELKLDRSFVVDVDNKAGRHQLMKSIIDMAHSLQLTVTAHGVETRAERAALEGLGCDQLQGNLIGPPVEVAAFVQMHQAQTS